MDQNRVSDLNTNSNSDRSLHDLIGENQVFGFIAILMGLSQVLLGLSSMESPWTGLTKSSWVVVVLGAGGLLLIGIGMSVFQGREAFDGGWIESERVTWLWWVMIFIFTVGVTATTVWVVLS